MDIDVNKLYCSKRKECPRIGKKDASCYRGYLFGSYGENNNHYIECEFFNPKTKEFDRIPVVTGFELMIMESEI